jgi:RNA polymerase sigma factor (sigma-70 family)
MTDDAELLKRYAEEGAEEAFAELVRRHVNLVHSAALRRTNGDAHLANDVTQMVFTDLARKARELSDRRVLAGWLFVSARYAAAKVVRSEQRRRRREQEVYMNKETNDGHATSADWERVRPVLDAAMGDLSEEDRAAVLMRYFENRRFAEVGARLRMSENSARMRVERAVGKLQALLSQRGVTSTSGALALVLSQHAVSAAPAGLAASVTGAALASGAGFATGVATFMGMTKLQLGLIGGIAAASTGGLVVQHYAAENLRSEVAALRSEAEQLKTPRSENLRRTTALSREREWRGDDAEIYRLRDEAADLRREFENRMRAKEVAEQAVAETKRRRVAEALRLASQTPGGDRAPTLSTSREPVYPPEMRAAGVHGNVLVEFVVDADGEVRDVEAIEATRMEFEAAAVEAVQAWKFLPGVKGQQVVNARLQQRVLFGPAGDTLAPVANPTSERPVVQPR